MLKMDFNRLISRKWYKTKTCKTIKSLFCLASSPFLPTAVRSCKVRNKLRWFFVWHFSLKQKMKKAQHSTMTIKIGFVVKAKATELFACYFFRILCYCEPFRIHVSNTCACWLLSYSLPLFFLYICVYTLQNYRRTWTWIHKSSFHISTFRMLFLRNKFYENRIKCSE